LSLDLWSLATEGTQEFPPLKNKLCEAEGMQEFPPLKKYFVRKHQFPHNFLSLCDNGSYKLPFFNAAEFGNSAEPRERSSRTLAFL
jgi:hypothetical protein